MPVRIGKTKFTDAIGRPRLYAVQWKADTEEEAETAIPLLFRGLPKKQASAVQWHPGSAEFIVNASYEGLLEDPPASQDEFFIDGEWREEKIESFPNRALLVDTYGAQEVDGRLVFPRLMPKVSASSTGTPRDDRSAEEENPLFNVRTYPVFFEVATWSFIRQRVPTFVNRARGQVLEKLPSGFEYDGEATQWFCTKAPRRKRGGSWAISLHYKEIDELKHVAALQALINQNGSSTGGGLGGTSLSTGGITTGTL